MLPEAQYRQLLNYPELKWRTVASERWTELCSRLRLYRGLFPTFSLGHERKWELASALQKSIRRADTTTGLRLVSAISMMPQEFTYFWRRVCVACCEDIGPADDELVRFTVACASIFTPKKTGAITEQILAFLVEEMCSLSSRSRIYCSMSIIESIVAEGNHTTLPRSEIATIAWIMARRKLMQSPVNPWQRWLSQNDWRGERMLRFLGLTLPEAKFRVQRPIPKHSSLAQLPSYSFDVHTRIGQEVLRRLIRGTGGVHEIKYFMESNELRSPLTALGMALFYVEGGRIAGEVVYPSLCQLEQALVANRHGLSLADFVALQDVLLRVLESGKLNQIRSEVLLEKYQHCDALESGSYIAKPAQSTLNFQ